LRWKKAQAIRAYIRHIQEFPSQYTGSENLNELISWAIEKAEWYDPAISKSDPLLSPFGEFHEALLNQIKQLDRYNIDRLLLCPRFEKKNPFSISIGTHTS
jgi:hypothetical protein